MLVIDGNVIRRIQTEDDGIDFMELSANLIRAHQRRYASTPSILDSDTTSKGLSPISLGYSPPSYEDIFGDKNLDLPPSYSELSLLFKQRQIQFGELNELRSFQSLAITNRIEQQETDLSEVVVVASSTNGNEETGGGGDEVATRGGGPTQTEEESSRNIEETPGSVSVPFESYQRDFSSGNCKYCIMSLDNERRAKIKCYCEEEGQEIGGQCSSSDGASNCRKDERISEIKESRL